MPAIDHPLIDQFLDALWLEKGLSDNTRDAYRSDLALFNGWLQEKGLELVKRWPGVDSRSSGLACGAKLQTPFHCDDSSPACGVSIAICCGKS
jgi:hypothetical protein